MFVVRGEGDKGVKRELYSKYGEGEETQPDLHQLMYCICTASNTTPYAAFLLGVLVSAGRFFGQVWD